MKAALAALLLVGIASAQMSEEALRPKVLSIRYPPLARAARVQGDVRLAVDSGGVTVVSGPPLLVQTAVDNAKSLGLSQSINLTYHFALSAPTAVPTYTTIKKGDAFDRFFMRIFGLKTEKVVADERCVEGAAPPNEVKISQTVIELWVYAGAMCAIVD